jgi:purine-binding chemotaxis protein CheW
VACEEVLSFHLAEVEYAVNILRVQEIRGWTKVTRIPRVPEYVKGVLNLRGAVVPVIDLRLRFDMPVKDYDDTTVIIILNVQEGHRKRDVGMVVDAVSDVFSVKAGEIRPAPELGADVQEHFIDGLISREERMVIVLDIDSVLSCADMVSHELDAVDAH